MLKFDWKRRVISVLAALVASVSAWAQPPVSFDYGYIPVDGTAAARTFSFPFPSLILWGKITIQAISAEDRSYLDIHTGSDPAGAVFTNSELALYDSTGVLIATSDDEGGNLRSLLSFGDPGPRPAIPSGGVPAGQTGPSLSAGTYYIAVAVFNASFSNGFSAISNNSGFGSGNIAVTVVSDRLPRTSPPIVAADLGVLASSRSPIEFGPIAVNGPTFYWTKFSLESATDANNYVDLHTLGTSITTGPFSLLVNDTELILYNDSGNVVASNDDFSGFEFGISALSGLSFGRPSGSRNYGNFLPFVGQNGQLTPGTYYVAVGAAELIPNSGFAVRQVARGNSGTGTLKLTIATNIPKALDYDLGAVTRLNSPVSSPVMPLAAGQVRWVKFRTTVATDAAGIFLDMHTLGSALAFNDTEIGLFRANGSLVDSNDDWAIFGNAPANESGLSFGRTAAPRSYGPMTNFAGQNGAVLAAGDYYVAIASYNSVFVSGLVVSPGNLGGTVKLTISTNAGSEVTYNFGEVSKRPGLYSSPSAALPLSSVRWFRFTTAQATSASGRFLNMHTDGSSLSSASITARADDTVLGLFDRFGNAIASNDDWGTQLNTGGIGNAFRSALSFGNTTPRSYGPVLGMAGQTAAVLPAGEYYVGITGYAVGWNVAAPFTVNSATTFQGSVMLNIITDLNATACNAADVGGLGGSAGADGILTADDIVVFLGAFFGGNAAIADIARLGGAAGADGLLTADDLVFFLGRFFVGCP